MEINRIQSFLATINGVEFRNERRFDVVEYILHLIEYEFGIEVTAQFVEDLDELVGDLRLASELTFADIEIILRDCVLESKSFDTLQFNIDSSTSNISMTVQITSTNNWQAVHIRRRGKYVHRHLSKSLRLLHNFCGSNHKISS